MKDELNTGRKFLKDRNLPGKEQIAKYKNFSKLSNAHSVAQKLFWKKMLIWNSVVLGTTAAGVGVYMYNTNDTLPVKTEQVAVMDSTKTQSCVVPPVPGKEIAFESYRIDPKKGGELHYGNGSVIKVPANAFQFKDGKLAEDSVDLRYREFHDISDIFLSGIPMQYDSAGQKFTFESDGMLELRAYSGNEELSMTGKEPVRVTMPCNNPERDFNLYYLDTLNKKWDYLGKAKPGIKNPENTVSQTNSKNDFTRTFEPEPEVIKPVAASSERYNFRVKFDKKSFPELAIYDNVLFEVTDNSFKPAFYRIHWDNIQLGNGDAKGSYTVRLKKADTSVTVSAVPVFDEKGLGTAQAKFRESHEQYLEKIKQQEIEDRNTLVSVNKDLQAYNRTDAARAAQRMNRNLDEGQRPIDLYQTGIHNFDVPIITPIVALIIAPVVIVVAAIVKMISMPAKETRPAFTQNTPELTYDRVYLAEKGKNAVFTFGKNEPIAFDPKAENLAWVMTQNGDFAFLSKGDFKKITANRSNRINPSFAKNKEEGLAYIKEFSK